MGIDHLQAMVHFFGAVNMNGTLEVILDHAELIQPEKVVDMSMGIDHLIDQRSARTEKLGTQIDRCIDEYIVPIGGGSVLFCRVREATGFQQNGDTGTFVMGIFRPADPAVAAQNRNPCRGSGPKKQKSIFKEGHAVG